MRKNLIFNLNNYSYWITLLAFFLFSIPNFYIVPFTQNPYLTSQAIGRVLFILAFEIVVITSIVNKKKIIKSQHKILFTFILLLFLFQSLSIISAINISSYLRRYKDVLLSIVVFTLMYHYSHKYLSFIRILIIASCINIFYELLLFFFPSYHIFFQSIIYKEHWRVVQTKLLEGKTYTETYNEITIPLFGWYFTKYKSHNKRFIIGLCLLTITLYSLLSNIRSRVLMLITSWIGSLALILKPNKKAIITIIFITLLLIILTDKIAFNITSKSLVSRFTFQDEIQDVRTITHRFDQVTESIIIGLHYPLGVGLGNYFDYLPSSEKEYFTTNSWNKNLIIGGTEYVHNYLGTILSESGFISLILFLILLYYFITNDYRILKLSNNTARKALVVSFWSLFIYGMFNPPVPGSYQVLFWGVRGLLSF